MNLLECTLVYLCLINKMSPSSSKTQHSVFKRSLLFPPSTILQFTYGVAVPAILPKRSINLSLCMQSNFELPNNITRLMPSVVSARSSGELDYDLNRYTLYKYGIAILNTLGLDGKRCLLRSICELAEIPMHVGESNLLENIIHYLLTPSEDLLTNNFTSYFRSPYLEAELIGKNREKCCQELFNCPFPLLDLFTKIFHV